MGQIIFLVVVWVVALTILALCAKHVVLYFELMAPCNKKELEQVCA